MVARYKTGELHVQPKQGKRTSCDRLKFPLTLIRKCWADGAGDGGGGDEGEEDG